MYIGIYLSDSQLSAAMLNQDEEMVLINDTTNSAPHRHGTPLKIYIEDNFAYVGNLVDRLIANDYDLPCSKYFLDGLEQTETMVYTDPTGVHWNASGLLSIFLKKLKGDVLVLNDRPVQGVMVTIAKPLTPRLIAGLELAFEMADLHFCGAVEMGKAALHGYGMLEMSSEEKRVLLYNLEATALTISVAAVDEENFSETLLIESEKNLGGNNLYDDIMDFLAKCYRQMTGNKIKKSAKNAIHLKKLARETLNKYFSESELYIRTVYYSTEPTIELILTRAQLSVIVAKFMDRSIAFLKESLQNAHIGLGTIDKIALTGDSKMLQMVRSPLENLFPSQQVKMHTLNSGEILTRGITLLVNDSAERNISSSLLAETDTVGTTEKAKALSGETVDNPELSQMFSIINSVQINRTGDM